MGSLPPTSAEFSTRHLVAYKRTDGTIAKYRMRKRDSHRVNPRLVRQWAMLRYLAGQRRAVSSAQLRRRFNISRSTVNKDLSTLVAAGFPIDEDLARDGKTHVWRFVGCCRGAEGERGGV